MTNADRTFATVRLGSAVDVLAPDTSEIRLLGRVSRASMAHGTLPPGAVSLAVAHRTVEEIWYVLSGRAEIWRKQANHEDVIVAAAGTSITIPTGTHFQFRTLGDEPFTFIMCTIPPWPGEHEAVRVPEHWNSMRDRA